MGAIGRSAAAVTGALVLVATAAPDSAVARATERDLPPSAARPLTGAADPGARDDRYAAPRAGAAADSASADAAADDDAYDSADAYDTADAYGDGGTGGAAASGEGSGVPGPDEDPAARHPHESGDDPGYEPAADAGERPGEGPGDGPDAGHRPPDDPGHRPGGAAGHAPEGLPDSAGEGPHDRRPPVPPVAKGVHAGLGADPSPGPLDIAQLVLGALLMAGAAGGFGLLAVRRLRGAR